MAGRRLLSPKTWLALALALAAASSAVVVQRARVRRPGPVSAAAPAASPLPGGVLTPGPPPLEGPRLDRANVVVVTVDTLRRDHLAPYGAPFETPAASRLAREGLVFERAVSPVPLTLPSHASLFTGLYPPRHAVHDNGGFVLGTSVTTLAERLQAAGYRTAAFVSSYVLHSRWGIAQGHETYDDEFEYEGLESRNLADVERKAGPVVDRALEWLQAPRRGERPFHLWVHLYDPHEPYAPPEAYSRRAPTAYAGEAMYADAQVERVLDALDALSLRERTVIAYLSDHGESLGEHGESTHGIFLYGATLDVPFLLAPPPGAVVGTPALPLAGTRVRGVASLVDLTPTLLDLVGLSAPDGLDGASLLPEVAREASAAAGAAAEAEPTDALAGPVAFAETYYPRFHYSWSALFAVETARWKYVRAPRPELYDLRADPREQRDVSAEHPRVAATLAAHLDASGLVKTGEEPKPARIDAEALERLQALGYVGGAEGAAPRRTGPPPDPKDRLPLLHDLLQGQALRDAGQLDQALRQLEELARKDPDNPAVHLALSSVHFRRKDAGSAIGAGRRAAELDPGSAVAALDLALACQAGDRIDEARTGFERVLELDPENLKALVNLAEIHWKRGEREMALGLYERAGAVAPRFALVQVNRGGLALELGRLAVAEDALRRAAALGGRPPPNLHFNLGVIAEQRGQPSAAAREYRAEVAAHPSAFKAWVNLGLLERQAGRTANALDAFERAASARPDDVAGPYLLAETLLGLGRRPEARRWAEEAHRRRPDDPRAQEMWQRVR